MAEEGRHGAGSVAKSLRLIHRYKAVRRLTENGLGFETSKPVFPFPQLPLSIGPHLPILPEQFHQLGAQHSISLGAILIKNTVVFKNTFA